MPPELATVRRLRKDLALQVTRHTQCMGVTQVKAAKQLGLPQPTLSKIINGHVSDVSLELLIRVAVRAGLPVTLQTGNVPEEAGAFRSGIRSQATRTFRSKVADAARQSALQLERNLTPAQRLETFLEHNQLLSALHHAGRAAETQRTRPALHSS